jgi:hypothetical protein
MDTEQIVKWAENKAKPSHRKPTKRLTQEEIGLLLKLHKDGLTQTEIAQRLDCDQAAVSRWLSKLTDSTETAKSYLRGSALRMARNIVHNGLARDHVQALKGLNVLEEQQGGGVVVQIGISTDLAKPTFASVVSADSPVMHSLTGHTESDNS